MHYSALPLTELLTDKATYEYMDGYPCSNLNEVIDWVDSRQRLLPTFPMIPSLRIIKFDGRYVGYIYLHHHSVRHHRVEISLAMHKDYRRKGIMKSELKRIISEIFRHTDIRVIRASCYEENLAARWLLSGAGMYLDSVRKDSIELRDGRLNNEYGYSINKTEWEKENCTRALAPCA